MIVQRIKKDLRRRLIDEIYEFLRLIDNDN